MTTTTHASRLGGNSDRHSGPRPTHSDSRLLLQHELRNCISSILLSAEVLALPDSCADHPLRDSQLDAIRSAVTHARELLNRVESTGAAATPELQVSMVPLQIVFDEVSKEIEAWTRSSGVTLTLPKLFPQWSVDSFVTRLALSNLLVNAIKYADAAKPDRWVRVRVEPIEGASPALVLEVADNGLGVPDRLQQRIFRRSFRAHPQVAEGTGLGLALTRERLVDRGGSIHFASAAGIGTIVRVTLRGGSLRLPVT